VLAPRQPISLLRPPLSLSSSTLQKTACLLSLDSPKSISSARSSQTRPKTEQKALHKNAFTSFSRLLTLLPDQTNGTMNKYFVPLASFGEFISRVTEIYKNGFGAFVLIAAIPVTLQLAAGMAGSVHPLVQLLASAAAFLAFVLARPATIYAITQIYLGKKPKVQECFAKTSHRLGALVVTGFVHVLFYVFASAGSYGFILALMLAFVSGSGMAILCLLLPFAVCVWGFFYFALALPLLVPSIIVEQKPVFETVHRVLQVASGYRIVVFWYGFGFGLIFGVLAGILGIFGVLAGILGTVLGPFTLLGLFPLVPIAEAVFYLDARCKQENLTAETLAHEIGAYFDHHKQW